MVSQSQIDKCRPPSRLRLESAVERIQVLARDTYLMTLSARYKTDCGIVRLICFAVLRLMINSNFVGWKELSEQCPLSHPLQSYLDRLLHFDCSEGNCCAKHPAV